MPRADNDQLGRGGHHFEKDLQPTPGIGNVERYQFGLFVSQMGAAFLEDRLNYPGVTHGFRCYLAVTNQALGTGLYAVISLYLDHGGEHRGSFLLADPDQFFRQRTHFELATSSSRSFHHGSMKTFMMPPQTAGLSDEMSSKRSTLTIRGLRVRITSIASRFTSASPQPPPMVPRISPHAVTTILAPTSRGVEPLVETIVATAKVSPLSRNSFTWWLIESFFFPSR